MKQMSVIYSEIYSVFYFLVCVDVVVHRMVFCLFFILEIYQICMLSNLLTVMCVSIIWFSVNIVHFCRLLCYERNV